MVLEQTSPPLWSGHWRDTDPRSPSVPKGDLATPDPVPSPPSPHSTERMPEHTADRELEPTTTDEPSPHGATELRIAAEPELLMTSVKVCEPATTPATREKAADGVSVDRSSTPCTVAEGELCMARWLCHTEEERAPVPELNPERAPIPEFRPESPEAHKCPPSHPLLPPLSSGSPSARSQPTIYAVRAPWDCHPPAYSPVSLDSASSLWAPDSAPAHWLHHCSLLSPLRRGPSVHWLCRAPSFLWLCLGLASTILESCLRTPLLRLRLVPSSSFIPSAPPQSSVAPAPPRPPGSTPLLCLGPPDPPRCPGSSALRLRLGLLHHLLRRRWSAPWSRRPFLLHGSSLRQLHRGPPL